MRSRTRLLALLAALAAVVTVAAGCSSSNDDADGKVVGSVDRGPTTQVRESKDGLRVVALGWSDGEIAASLGVKPVAIYDWMGFGDENKGVGPWATDKFGDDSPTVIKNSGTTYNYEQIELLEPDLILNVRASGDSKVFDRLSQIAPVASAPAGTPDFAVNWREQTELIGKAIGKTEEAKAAVAETDSVISKAKTANPEFAGRSFVYAAKFGDAYGAYIRGDARFDVFAELGFAAYKPVEDLKTSGFFVNVPAEKVTALDAQTAVFTTISKPLSELQSDRLIDSLPVVRDGRALIIDENDEINQGLAAGTPQSIALAVQAVTPKLAAIIK
ncbi:ABC transporter substrate-binding protein [Gordonia humi]